jgi:hypothetical protein
MVGFRSFRESECLWHIFKPRHPTHIRYVRSFSMATCGKNPHPLPCQPTGQTEKQRACTVFLPHSPRPCPSLFFPVMVFEPACGAITLNKKPRQEKNSPKLSYIMHLMIRAARHLNLFHRCLAYRNKLARKS